MFFVDCLVQRRPWRMFLLFVWCNNGLKAQSSPQPRATPWVLCMNELIALQRAKVRRGNIILLPLTGRINNKTLLPRALPWASYVVYQILDDVFVLIYVIIKLHKPEDSTHNSHRIFSRLVPLQPKFSAAYF